VILLTMPPHQLGASSRQSRANSPARFALTDTLRPAPRRKLRIDTKNLVPGGVIDRRVDVTTTGPVA